MARHLILRIFIGALLFSFVSFDSPLTMAAETVMQCMSNCVKHEGNTASAKSTCKSRCANVPVPSANSGNQADCMGTYKACNRSCAKKDKACKRQCKSGLMSCK